MRPEFRRRGLGWAMLEGMVSDAREIGYTQMRAEVSLLMREGIALYDSYENVDELDAFDGHEGEDWGTTQHQKFLTYDIPVPGNSFIRKS